MKKLHLIRHAESSLDESQLADIDRALNSEGIKACKIMGQKILNEGCHFEHVYCSTAARAQSTISYISDSLKTQNIKWQLDQALYTFNSQDLLRWCQALDESMLEVVIIGHNFAITDFCNQLSDVKIECMPTCSYVQLAYEGNLWSDLPSGLTKLVSFIKPSMFKL